MSLPEQRCVALTVDYELFGNGAGDVREHVIEPMARMARVGENAGVPFTVFFEVEEYLAFERHSGELGRALGYDPAIEIGTQIRELAAAGHDIQLHLHPEWYGARYRDGQWQLNPERRTVEDLFDTQRETDDYIAERKLVIETLVKGTRGGARGVRVYRAGAFRAQPGTRLLPALATNGISLDSSVVKGMWRHRDGEQLDYRSAPADKRWWRVQDNVAVEADSGDLVEIPIHSRPRRRWTQVGYRRLKAKFSSHVPRSKQKELVSQLGVMRNPMGFLLERVPVKLDYHNMSARTLMRWIKAPPPAPAPDILVLIGHTKEHISDAALGQFVAAVARDTSLTAVTLGEAVDWFRYPRPSEMIASAIA